MMRKLFKIHEGEGLKVFTFFLLGSFLQAGLIMGVSISDALFLVHVGPDKLSLFYIIMPAIMIVFVLTYSWLLQIYGLNKVFLLTLLLLIGGGIAVGFINLQPEHSPWLYYLFKIYTFAWLITLYSVYWIFVDRYFSILDAKRLYPILSGGLLFGAALGGGLVTYFSAIVSAAYFFFGWALLAFLGIFCFLFILIKWVKIDEDSDDQSEAGFLGAVKTVFNYSKKSKFIYTMNGAIFLTIFLTTIAEYQYSAVFAEGRNEAELASFFGKLFLLANGFTLLIALFGFSRLVIRVGVSNITLVQPVAYLIAFLYFLLDYGPSSALFGFMAYQGIMIGIDYNNWNFLFNAFPGRVKQFVRIFTESLTDPIATAFAGVFLLWGVSYLSPQQISGVALLVAAIFIVTALILRGQYLLAMIHSLRDGALDFSRDAKALLSNLKDSDMRLLSHTLSKKQEGQKGFEAFFHVLWSNDRNAAAQAVLKALDNLPIENEREVCNALAFILDENDASVSRQFLIWLGQCEADLPPAVLEEFGNHGFIRPSALQPISQAESLSEKQAAIVTLNNSWKIEDTSSAMEGLSQLFKGTEEEVISGIKILGRMRKNQYVYLLKDFLSSPSHRVRYEALFAISKIVDESSSYALPFLIENLQAADSNIRLVTMEAIDKIQDSASIIPLLSASERFTPLEQRRAKGIILKMGLKSVPMVVSVFLGGHYSYASSSLAAKALCELAFPQFESSFPKIIDEEIEKAYQALLFYTILSEEKGQSPAIFVLSNFYKKIHEVIVDYILRVLTLGGRLPDFELISNSLHSHNLKIRGDAIETLEQGVNRKVFKLLLPLVDMRSTSDILEFYYKVFPISGNDGRTLQHMKSMDVINKALESPFSLERSIAAQAYWEKTGEKEALNEWLERFEKENTQSLPEDIVHNLLAKDLLRRGELQTKPNLGSVDKLYYMLQNPFLVQLGMEELNLFSHFCEEKEYKKEWVYRKGESADAFYLIVEGEVMLKQKGKDVIHKQGDIFGEEEIFFRESHAQDVYAEHVRVLVFHKEALSNATSPFPQISMAFLKRHSVEV